MNIRGKTVQRNPERAEMDYVENPPDPLSFHKNMMLVTDVMFVNSVPFLVLVSGNINLITIEHAPKHHSASKLGYLLQRIINVYACAGFCVQISVVHASVGQKVTPLEDPDW
jgi:hypothetical protein